ncbi:hypothetical protein B0H14DRAFT_3124266 [Mycena olivaceomarginata]|nr:hypothetical protein B0H14DRAFT_3124266 [Mycena olivaceomarginata]
MASTSAALDCLGTVDILTQVLKYLLDLSSDGLGENHIVTMALTCATFCEPCLDILWRNLSSLVPLLKPLPSFAVVNGVYALLGPLHASNFIRFDYHAAKVRSMTCTDADDIPIDPSVFVRIAQHHRELMLPLLHRLHIASTAHLGPSIMLLGAPTLHDVHFASNEPIDQGVVFHTFLSVAAHSDSVGRKSGTNRMILPNS